MSTINMIFILITKIGVHRSASAPYIPILVIILKIILIVDNSRHENKDTQIRENKLQMCARQGLTQIRENKLQMYARQSLTQMSEDDINIRYNTRKKQHVPSTMDYKRGERA